MPFVDMTYRSDAKPTKKIASCIANPQPLKSVSRVSFLLFFLV